MFGLFRALSLRYLFQRWDRATLIVASIALGVATLVSTRILNSCIESVVTQSTNPIALGDLQISNGELGFSRSVAKELEDAKLPQIKSMLPLVMDLIEYDEVTPPRRVILFGTDLGFLQSAPSDPKSESLDVTERLKVKIVLDPNQLQLAFKFARGRWALISEDLYKEREKAGLGMKDPLKVLVAKAPQSFDIAGYLIFDKDSPALNFSRNLIATDYQIAASALKVPSKIPVLSTMQSLAPPRITRLDLFLNPGANAEEFLETVQKIVGNRAKVRTPEQQRKATEDVIGGIQISFSLCAVGAMIVGLFLVYNSLSVSVAERRHDIGILRSLGATQYQITRLFTMEAMTLGLIGGAIGIPLGKLLAEWAIGQFRTEIISVSLSEDALPTHMTWGIASFAILCGLITSLTASLIPAIQAASDQPADAVRRAPSPVAGLLRILHLIACVIMVGGGVAMVAFRESLPDRMGAYVGLVFTLTGLFLAMPLFVHVLARAFQPIFRSIFGIEGRLAADNLIRAPGRTGIVIGALAGGVSLMFQTAGVGRSNEEPVVEWIDQVLKADAYIFWGNIVSATSSSTPMLPYIAKKIENEIPGVEAVVRQRYYRPEFNNTVVYLQAMDAVTYGRTLTERSGGKSPRGVNLFPKLVEGPYCVVSDNFLIRHKREIGDKITIPGPKGPVTLEIIGSAADYSWSKGTIIVDFGQYVKLFEDDYVDLFHVFFKKDANPEETLKALSTKMASDHQLLTETQAMIKATLRGEIDKIYKLAYIQQLVVAVVAALGVVMALLISVLQRRRELGLLRAVGATRTQVLSSVLAEAMMMGVLGTFLGILLGIPLEWYLLRVVLFEESGFYFEVLIPWMQTLIIAFLAIAVATAAGLLPALHAVRLKVAEAIAYE
jgi:putative ABC transport system permease protein